MLRGIISRRHRSSSYNDTEIKTLKAATKLFLAKGYSSTTIRNIANEAGIQVSNVAYYFRTKEDILYLLIEELMNFHSSIIEKVHEETDDDLFSYATEIALQIALCEENPVARDLYQNAYIIDGVCAVINEWAYKKNMVVFKERLPEWTEQDFRNVENFASQIEFGAIKFKSEAGYTLEDKISLTLELLFKTYNVAEEESRAIIEKILASDYKQHAQDVFRQFIERFEKSAEEFNL